MPTKRRFTALMVLALSANVLPLVLPWPAMAQTSGEMEPAVTINYTQRDVRPERILDMLVTEVKKVSPDARYDIVGYETTPKKDFWPVSTRVKEIQDMLVAKGVDRKHTYVLVKPTDTPYQKIDIFVRN